MNIIIVVVLLLVVSGLWIAYKTNRITKTTLEIFAAITTIGALVVIILNLIFPNVTSQPPQDDDQETQGTNETEVVSTIYDDFDDLTSDGEFDSNRWEIYEDFECGVEQKDGQAIFTANNSGSSSVLCIIHTEQVTLEEVGSMEAKFSTTDEAKGDFSIGIIEFSNGTFEEGTETWIAQCGLRHTQEENPIELFFNVHSTYPKGNPDNYKTVPASAGRWYKMRLELDPDFEEIRCYANDKFIGNYNPPNKNSLTQAKFGRKLLGFWTPGSQATFFADDVRISPVE